MKQKQGREGVGEKKKKKNLARNPPSLVTIVFIQLQILRTILKEVVPLFRVHENPP